MNHPLMAAGLGIAVILAIVFMSKGGSSPLIAGGALFILVMFLINR